MIENAREIFETEVNRRYEKHKLKFDNHLKKLHIVIQIDILKTWIKKIESLFEDDIDKLKDDYYTGISFNLLGIIQINFSGIDGYEDFLYFRETKEFGHDFRAITNPDIQECLKNDSSRRNLKYQLIIDELLLLKAYFSKKLILLENHLSTKEDNFELIDTLEKACGGKDTKKYRDIKAWFIEHELCDPDTFAWKDRKKGNKSILIKYLCDLHVKGYTDQLTHKQIQAIVKNSFNILIGIDLIKQVSSKNTITKEGKDNIPPFKD